VPNLTPFIVTGLALGSVYALSGMGMVILFRATGELNFAMGGVGGMGALVAWTILDNDLPMVLALAAAVVVATVLSAIYGIVVSPRLAHRTTIVKGVATLGFALVLYGLMLFIWSDDPRRLRISIDFLTFSMGGVRVTGTRTLAFLLCIGFAVGVTLVLNRTRLGLTMRSLADNRDLSALLGVQVERTAAIAWLLIGIFSGVVGILLASLVRLDAGVLTFLVIPAVASAILGRLQNLWLALAGGLLIGVVEAVLTPFPALAPYRTLTPFLIALVFLSLQSGSAFATSRRI
jgi:branched-chain amino acid transport system permease protein